MKRIRLIISRAIINMRVYVARTEVAEALEEACEGDRSCSALVMFTSFVTRIPGVLTMDPRLCTSRATETSEGIIS
jgi:hypothetical protein